MRTGNRNLTVKLVAAGKGTKSLYILWSTFIFNKCIWLYFNSVCVSPTLYFSYQLNISIKYCMNMNRCKDPSFEASASFSITPCINLTNALTSETERHWRSLMWAVGIMWDLTASKQTRLFPFTLHCKIRT